MHSRKGQLGNARNLRSLSRCNASPSRRCRPSEKWTLDQIRRLSLRRGEARKTLAIRRCSTSASMGSWRPLPRSRATPFSMENWLPWIQKGPPSFQMLQNSLSQSLPIHFYAFDLLNRNSELLEKFRFFRRREALESLITGTPDLVRLSPLLRTPSGQVVEAVRKLGLEGVVRKTDRFFCASINSARWLLFASRKARASPTPFSCRSLLAVR